MPDDGASISSVDWTSVLQRPHGWGKLVHEDDTDSLNDDGTWGPESVGAVGGSGIVFGYSVEDLAAVVVAEQAVHLRTAFYDWEHWVRQTRYATAAWEMTHDRRYARRIVQYGEMAGAAFAFPGAISYGQGWTPFSISQYLDMAAKDPHNGIQGANLRQMGWLADSRAMQLKVTPNDPKVRSWIEGFLALCELAAMPGTGQLTRDMHVGVVESDVQYTFHWAICAHAAMNCAYRLGKRVPRWVVAGMRALSELPVMDYYGSPSPPAFLRTVGGKFVLATGPAQDGDPAHGWWSTNCAALARDTKDSTWVTLAKRYGPQDKASEQARKESMLLRGLLSA